MVWGSAFKVASETPVTSPFNVGHSVMEMLLSILNILGLPLPLEYKSMTYPPPPTSYKVNTLTTRIPQLLFKKKF